jgi:uncharacterized membrane protein AbrB (regulator of aidB expression)
LAHDLLSGMSRVVAVCVAVALVVALFVGGSQPGAAGLVPAPWDKLAHVAVFAVLTLALVHGFRVPAGWAAVVALGVGAADEVHQSFLPGRVASVDDWLADLAGVALVLCVLWWWRRGLDIKRVALRARLR